MHVACVWHALAKCNQAMNALCEPAGAGRGAMCENTQSASWLGGCSRLIRVVRPTKPSSSVVFFAIRLTGCQGGMFAVLVLVQARASLPSNMETISPTAHIDWVSCRYVRASTRPLQREVTRWGNCVSNAEIASTTKIVNEIHDGDKQLAARGSTLFETTRMSIVFREPAFFRSFLSSSARPSANSRAHLNRSLP